MGTGKAVARHIHYVADTGPVRGSDRLPTSTGFQASFEHPSTRARTLYWRSDVPTPWMRFVIRAPVGERLVSFCSEIGAESVSDGLEALLQAWKEVARAEVRTDA